MTMQLLTASLSAYNTSLTWPMLLSLVFNNLEHEAKQISYKFISSTTKNARFFCRNNSFVKKMGNTRIQQFCDEFDK
jgi:hypothetical protein